MRTSFTHQQNKVLSEIYRRLYYFTDGSLKDQDTALLYLAYPSEAKIIAKFELIEPHSRETPKVLSWYGLTEKGKAFFKKYKPNEKLSEEENLKLFLGENIKEFDKSLLPNQ